MMAAKSELSFMDAMKDLMITLNSLQVGIQLLIKMISLCSTHKSQKDAGIQMEETVMKILPLMKIPKVKL